MSLISNRGRFTLDNEKKEINNDSLEQSNISLIGVNPKSIFDLNKDINDIDNDIKERINSKITKSVDFDIHDNHIPSHKEYNLKLSKKDDDLSLKEDKETIYKPVKRKIKLFVIVLMVIVELITLAGIYIFGSVYRYLSLTQEIDFDPKKVENINLDPITIEKMKGYKTVAVFGVDSRTGSVGKGNNSDVNIIANLNLETGEIQLVSVYRDLYLSITDDNLFGKLNAAYLKGGPEQAVKVINKNFDININSYFAFNWKAVADGIQLLGGIDIEVTKSEYKYLNAFIHETCIATGIDDKNPAAHYVKSYGYQHLDGVQAVAYGRLRLMDSDFQRVERQKKIVGLCLEKAKKIDIPTLRMIVEAVLPQIGYSYDINEIFSLLKLINVARITESTGCPDVSSVRTVQMGSNGDCVVPLNLQKSVTILHKILFNADNYNPSSSVKHYSNRITELRRKHEEENKLKGQTGESVEGESIGESESGDNQVANSESKSSSTKASEKSSTNKETKTNSNLPISDDSNIEEPESDSLPISNNSNNNNTNSNNSNKSNDNNNINNNTNSNNNNNNNNSNNSNNSNDNNNTNSNNNNNNNNSNNNNNEFIEYVSPGVPASNENTRNVAPGSNAANNNSQNNNSQAVVVPGPPTGDISQNNTNVTPNTTENIVNSNEVVPIIGAPF